MEELNNQSLDIITFNKINELNNLGKAKKDDSLVFLNYLLSYALSHPYWLCSCKLDLIRLYINKSCSQCH